MFHLLIPSTQFIQFFQNEFELFIFVSESWDRFAFLDPVFPLFILEFLSLNMRFADVFGSWPKPPIIFLSIFSQFITLINVFFTQIFMRFFWQLSIPISNGYLSNVGFISQASYRTKKIRLLFVVFRSSNGQLHKLPLDGLFEVRLRTLPHLFRMNVAHSNQLKLWKIKSDELQGLKTD